jgi:hypothetical protein
MERRSLVTLPNYGREARCGLGHYLTTKSEVYFRRKTGLWVDWRHGDWRRPVTFASEQAVITLTPVSDEELDAYSESRRGGRKKYPHVLKNMQYWLTIKAPEEMIDTLEQTAQQYLDSIVRTWQDKSHEKGLARGREIGERHRRQTGFPKEDLSIKVHGTTAVTKANAARMASLMDLIVELNDEVELLERTRLKR